MAPRSFRVLLGAALALPLLAVGSPAEAQTGPGSCRSLGVQDGGSAFTEFVRGNSSRTGDSSGRIAVGGNLSTLSGFFSMGSALPNVPSSKNLIVGGTLAASNQMALQRGSATYGAITPSLFYNGGGSGTIAPPPFSFATEFAALQGLAGDLAALPSAGTKTYTAPDLTWTLTNTGATRNVFHLTAAELLTAKRVKVKVDLGSTTIIDISGQYSPTDAQRLDSVFFWDGVSYQQPGANDVTNASNLRNRTLWSFATSTTVRIAQVNWGGSLLAPLAALQFDNGQLNGGVYVASMTGTGETHHVPFVGCLPANSPDPVVPEGRLALGVAAALIVGGGAIVLRRTHAAAA